MIWVSTRKATFGIVAREGRIVECAPYGMKVLKRKGIETADEAISYFLGIGATVMVKIKGEWRDTHPF